ncbi:MAG: universal stress protein [Actinomycetota bacterium]|nr:universal stress protein [Actinomycetota bacterium]
MNVTAGRRRLHVLVDAPDVPELWWPLVGEVAQVADANPVADPWPAAPDEEDVGQAILARAGDHLALVLPGLDVGTDGVPVHLRRLLVPVDRSPEERDALAPIVHRARDLGLAVGHLHVLTPRTRPVIWEGPGHHAEAWHAELRRRQHLGEGGLTVASGDPAGLIRRAGRRSDLVVLCWQGDPAAGRARVVRGVLAGARPPLLLVSTGLRGEPRERPAAHARVR